MIPGNVGLPQFVNSLDGEAFNEVRDVKNKLGIGWS
jgi:hypothetical protein